MVSWSLPWEAVPVLLPLTGAVLTFLWPRQAAAVGLAVAAGIGISLAALVPEMTVGEGWRHPVGGWTAPLGIELHLDALALIMLIMTALVGLGVSLHARVWFHGRQAARFWPLWLSLWAALDALFLAADLFNLYVTMELIGLSAVAMVALAGGRGALEGALRYLLVSLAGSLFYLLGVALLFHGFGTLDLALLAQRADFTPPVMIALGVMAGGLLLKTALFPLHFWLPDAHASAPAPVSAVLSALVVKASFYVLLRLWLALVPAGVAPGPGLLLGGLGVAAVFWGGFQALRQSRLKPMVAYSTVAQVGYLFLAFPIATAAGWRAAILLLLAHALAKAAMFLAAGNLLRHAGHDRIAGLDRIPQRLPLTITAFALAGVSLMGLPPSGGFVGKWMLMEAAMAAGQWWWALVPLLGGLLTAAYVFRVIGHAFTPAPPGPVARSIDSRLEWAALSLAVLAVLSGMLAFWPLGWLEGWP